MFRIVLNKLFGTTKLMRATQGFTCRYVNLLETPSYRALPCRLDPLATGGTPTLKASDFEGARTSSHAISTKKAGICPGALASSKDAEYLMLSDLCGRTAKAAASAARTGDATRARCAVSTSA